jgi:hypothetical protein
MREQQILARAGRCYRSIYSLNLSGCGKSMWTRVVFPPRCEIPNPRFRHFALERSDGLMPVPWWPIVKQATIYRSLTVASSRFHSVSLHPCTLSSRARQTTSLPVTSPSKSGRAIRRSAATLQLQTPSNTNSSKMPPKQKGGGSKVADDKVRIAGCQICARLTVLTKLLLAGRLQTFGMKNKNKSSKVQKFIAQVDQQSKMAGKNKEQVSWSVGTWNAAPFTHRNPGGYLFSSWRRKWPHKKERRQNLRKRSGARKRLLS